MYFARLIRLLLVALSIASVAQAIRIDNARIPNGAVVKRQQDSTDTANNEPESTTPTPTPSPTTPPDDDDEESTTTTSTRSTEENTPPTTAPTDTSTSSTRTTESTPDPTTTGEGESDEPITETFTEVVTTTNADGVATSFTTHSTVTRTPGLSEEGSGGSSGMSTETRNIVIGVVVGVGGAIVLGALGFVAWRIWGRKKAAEEPDNFAPYEPMDKSDAGNSPTGGVVGPRNPFQQTLETYHAPTQVNASSNF